MNSSPAMCAWEANQLLWAGDWRNCQRRLRVALGARPGPRGDVVARLTAAALGCLQGRQAEAEGHVARAEEIFAMNKDVLRNVAFDETRALLALEAGNPERAPQAQQRSLQTRADAETARATRDPAELELWRAAAGPAATPSGPGTRRTRSGVRPRPPCATGAPTARPRKPSAMPTGWPPTSPRSGC
jgi:hypothetical protein